MPFATQLLWQNDDRWAATPLGYGPQTIKDWGCLTTSLTMALNGCGYNETPATVSQKMVKIGAFHGAGINSFRIGEAFPNMALKELVDCEKSDAPMARIDTELSAGKPVLIRVDWNAAPGLQDHWVLLLEKSGSDYLMYDPWRYKGDEPGKPILLTSRYKHTGQTAAKAITAVIFFTVTGKTDAAAPAPVLTTASPAPAPAPVTATGAKATEKKPLPLDSVMLNPTIEGVALRGSPDVAGPLICRFSVNAAFKSLEPRAATLAKLGITGQWLNVQSFDGQQGYVAAWYAKSAEALAPSQGMPETDETPAGEGIAPAAPAAPAIPMPVASQIVTVIEDQLAFRSQPVVADTTLITRLPLGTKLTVIDPQASKKLGVANQWLQVKDATGREGYVAAWYVK